MKELPRNILISLALTDGADSGESATERDRTVLEQGLRMARCCKARVRVFHVLNLPEESLAPQYNALVTEDRERATKALQDLVDALPEETRAGIPEITCGAGVGRPWMQTLQENHRWGGDLIVIGPSVHHRLLDRILHGSTAGRLIRKASVPLWIVDADNVSNLKRILVPIDLRPVSEDLVYLANQLRGVTGAELHLLHCVSFPLDIAMHRHPDAQNKLKEYHAETIAAAEKRIDELLGSDRTGWQVTLRQDPITKAVPDMIDKHDIDLILIAGVSLPRVAGVLLGTTAEKILSKIHAPSYVIKPEGWESPVRFD